MRLQPPPDEIIAEIVDLYESGLSFASISKKFRASPQTVRRYVDGRGVSIQDAHELRRLANEI
jgi:hypothetical protein